MDSPCVLVCTLQTSGCSAADVPPDMASGILDTYVPASMLSGVIIAPGRYRSDSKGAAGVGIRFPAGRRPCSDSDAVHERRWSPVLRRRCQRRSLTASNGVEQSRWPTANVPQPGSLVATPAGALRWCAATYMGTCVEWLDRQPNGHRSIREVGIEVQDGSMSVNPAVSGVLPQRLAHLSRCGSSSVKDPISHSVRASCAFFTSERVSSCAGVEWTTACGGTRWLVKRQHSSQGEKCPNAKQLYSSGSSKKVFTAGPMHPMASRIFERAIATSSI